jgi:hypothetical protein
MEPDKDSASNKTSLTRSRKYQSENRCIFFDLARYSEEIIIS